MSGLSEREVYAKTVYAEARGEPLEGQVWVAWVIKNRANMNREYWGGSTIKGVCLKQDDKTGVYQFECWKGKQDIEIREHDVYNKIKLLTDSIYDQHIRNDPTGGADHYNNPSKEGYPQWTKNCRVVRTIGSHVFYKGP